MKKFLALPILAACQIALTFTAQAQDERGGQYIEFSKNPAVFDAYKPSTGDKFTGRIAHLVARIEAPQGNSISNKPQQVIIFPTEDGRYVIRIEQLSDGYGWFGPY